MCQNTIHHVAFSALPQGVSFCAKKKSKENIMLQTIRRSLPPCSRPIPDYNTVLLSGAWGEEHAALGYERVWALRAVLTAQRLSLNRGGESCSGQVTTRLATRTRDPQALKVRRQISVQWPRGWARATVSHLFRGPPWGVKLFMRETIFIACLCVLDVDIFDIVSTWAHAYMMMPQVEEMPAGYLSPGSSTSLNKPALPTKPCRLSRRPVLSAILCRLWLPWRGICG